MNELSSTSTPLARASPATPIADGATASEWWAAARAWEQTAEHTAAAAVTVGGGRSLAWESAAGDAFRAELGECEDDLRRLAHAQADLAAALRQAAAQAAARAAVPDG